MPGRHGSLIAICGMNEQRNSATWLTFSGSQFFSPYLKQQKWLVKISISASQGHCIRWYKREFCEALSEAQTWRGCTLSDSSPPPATLVKTFPFLELFFPPGTQDQTGQSLIWFPVQTKVFQQSATVLLCKIPFYEETFKKFQEISKKNRIHWFF